MGDQDWLDTGHGGGEGLQPMIKGSSSRAVDRVSIRSVLRGPESGKPRGPRRRNKALVGWLLYCATAVGGTAAAFTVRDTLFPSLGAQTDNKVWIRTSDDTTVTTEPASSSTANVDTTVATTVATTIATAAQSVEAQTVPTVSNPAQGPSDSIDSSGPGGGGETAPGTTVDGQSSGPGPGTTVDDHPTDTSTPESPPSSEGATPASASTPTDTSPGHQSGKGGGSGGGGNDDPPTP